MCAGRVLLWIIFYVAIAVSAVGHWWRYRRDQFSWTSRSIELLDRRILGWTSPAFHYGALAAVSGPFIRLCIPTPEPARSASPRAPTSGSRRSRRHRGGVTGRVIGLVYQLHAIIAWVFWAFFPFSRLVHAWNISPQHLGRPYPSTDAAPLPRAG